MRPLPTHVESAWLVTGPDRDATYLMLVRLERDDGVWRVLQWIGSGPQHADEYADEQQARAHLARVYAEGEQHGRWRVRRT